MCLLVAESSHDVIDDEKSVMDTLESMAIATIAKNLGTLGQLYHDDLTYSHSDARCQTKAQVLEQVRVTPPVIHKLS